MGSDTTGIEIAALMAAWEVAGPWRVSPLAGGTNNLVWRVESPEGGYVAHVYGHDAEVERLRFEHDVLGQLDAMGLPFALPMPIPTRDGALVARVRSPEGEALATLTRLIPGERPDRDDLARAEAAGEAFGRLDVAMAEVAQANPEDGVSWRTTGDLTRCHPLVPDPLEGMRSLPVAEETRARLLAGYDDVMARTPALYATLPQQIVHEDFDPGNLLVLGTRVTGVLDFEFCGRDVRAMDLTVAMSWWPVRVLGTEREWPIVRALADGYARQVRLSKVEIAAMPTLLQFRSYTSLIHRQGRFRQGLATAEEVAWRVEAALERDDWLRAHGERLIAELRAAFGWAG